MINLISFRVSWWAGGVLIHLSGYRTMVLVCTAFSDLHSQAQVGSDTNHANNKTNVHIGAGAWAKAYRHSSHSSWMTWRKRCHIRHVVLAASVVYETWVSHTHMIDKRATLEMTDPITFEYSLQTVTLVLGNRYWLPITDYFDYCAPYGT